MNDRPQQTVLGKYIGDGVSVIIVGLLLWGGATLTSASNRIVKLETQFEVLQESFRENSRKLEIQLEKINERLSRLETGVQK